MKQLIGVALSIFLLVLPAGAGDLPEKSRFEITTEFTYRAGGEETEAVARALALFGARMKAVSLAAKYFTHEGALAHYEKRQHEIYCLVPGQIASTVLEERNEPQSRSCYVKIRSEISAMDFIRAENADAEMQKKEAGFSFGTEMRQPVAGDIDPGSELSRAYRYLRLEEWRVAIIYLDHLEKKYPNWMEVPLAKAIALYSTGDKTGMQGALERACGLGSQEACDELKSFGPDFK